MHLLSVMSFIVFLDGIDLFQLRLVRQRHVAFDTAVVQIVGRAFLQITEQTEQIDDAADAECRLLGKKVNLRLFDRLSIIFVIF